MRRDRKTNQCLAKLGRKKTKTGKIDGHLFRFSTNEKESERRKLRIQELWDYAVETLGDTEWNNLTLHIAKCYAKGETKVPFSLNLISEEAGDGFVTQQGWRKFPQSQKAWLKKRVFSPKPHGRKTPTNQQSAKHSMRSKRTISESECSLIQIQKKGLQKSG